MNHCDCHQGRRECPCSKPALIDHPLVNIGFAIGIGLCLTILALAFFGVLRP
jgi:hypothetical protein